MHPNESYNTLNNNLIGGISIFRCNDILTAWSHTCNQVLHQANLQHFLFILDTGKQLIRPADVMPSNLNMFLHICLKLLN